MHFLSPCCPLRLWCCTTGVPQHHRVCDAAFPAKGGSRRPAVVRPSTSWVMSEHVHNELVAVGPRTGGGGSPLPEAMPCCW
jgi:hypothetical protein